MRDPTCQCHRTIRRAHSSSLQIPARIQVLALFPPKSTFAQFPSGVKILLDTKSGSQYARVLEGGKTQLLGDVFCAPVKAGSSHPPIAVYIKSADGKRNIKDLPPLQPGSQRPVIKVQMTLKQTHDRSGAIAQDSERQPVVVHSDDTKSFAEDASFVFPRIEDCFTRAGEYQVRHPPPFFTTSCAGSKHGPSSCSLLSCQ